MLRDNANSGQVALYIFIGMGVVLVTSAIFSFIYFLALGGNSQDSTQGLVLGGLQGVINLVQLGLVVLSAIYFIRWARRAYFNLGTLGVGMEHPDSWVAGAWFVPVISLYRPYTIMREIWQKTQRMGYGTVTSHTLLRVWWLLFLLRGVVGFVSILAMGGPDSLLATRNTLLGFVSADLFDAVAVLVTIQMIRRIMSFEQQMQLQAQVVGLGQAAPMPLDAGATEEEQYL